LITYARSAWDDVEHQNRWAKIRTGHLGVVKVEGGEAEGGGEKKLLLFHAGTRS